MTPPAIARTTPVVVAQVQRDAAIVGDRTLAQPVRAEALRFLIHFVGDLHQPLHAGDNHDEAATRSEWC